MADSFQDIINAIVAGKNNYGENLCWSALKTNPNSSYLNKLLGITLLKQEKFVGAVSALLKTFPDGGKDFDINNNLAFAYIKIEDYENAKYYADQADLIKPETYAVNFNKSQIFFALRDFDLSLSHINKCYKLIDTSANEGVASHANLRRQHIELLFAKNDLSGAKQLMLDTLSSKFDPRAFFDLANLDASQIDKSLIQKAEKYLDEGFSHFLQKTPVYFGIGRFYEKQKKFGEAFDQYKKGNDIKASALRFKPYLAQEKLKKNLRLFSKEFFDDFYSKKDEKFMKRGNELIFIVGSPRSGTTLVESIIASSDKVGAAGELSSFINIGEEMFDDIHNGNLDINYEFLGNSYLRKIKNIFPNKKLDFLIDKMPANIHYIGFIKMVFPAAKIICLKREPIDCAWSIYTQYYLNNIPYSSDLFNLGIELANVQALMSFWSDINNSKNFLLADYEKIVSDPENFTKILFDHIGLEGSYDEEKRRSFYSKTASKTQVQKKIYTTSVSRSKVFEQYLLEFQESYKNQCEFWDLFLEENKIN